MTRAAIVTIAVAAAVGWYYTMTSFTPKWLVTLGDGIATAEGFGVAGAIPTTHNNPGDITDNQGNKLTFGSVADGFRALYQNITGGLSGESAYYYGSMSLAEFAQTWTGGDDPSDWLATVLAHINSVFGTSLTGTDTLSDVASLT